MDHLFIRKDSFLYDYPPVVVLLGKSREKAVESLQPFIEAGKLRQRDADSTLALVSTVMDERLSWRSRILHCAGFSALSFLATAKIMSRRRWSVPARILTNSVAAMAATELFLINRIILVDHARWENALTNRAGMRNVLQQLHASEFVLTDPALQSSVHAQVETIAPADRWEELRMKSRATKDLILRRAGTETPIETHPAVLNYSGTQADASPPHEPLDMTEEERRFLELVESREKASSC
ncbi:hypothetical protein BD626DRAFT_34542 [Schizophyllum amplum]|uniref:Uncharacterized protein n=1 Tax=Schizophyllum amplum TaxID=97359 RepID=A0A550CEF6_9AGAR|nr:hypothetical protein BD626DRAFT_34542 [Auriculariopsis ampla]